MGYCSIYTLKHNTLYNQDSKIMWVKSVEVFGTVGSKPGQRAVVWNILHRIVKHTNVLVAHFFSQLLPQLGIFFFYSNLASFFFSHLLCYNIGFWYFFSPLKINSSFFFLYLKSSHIFFLLWHFYSSFWFHYIIRIGKRWSVWDCGIKTGKEAVVWYILPRLDTHISV